MVGKEIEQSPRILRGGTTSGIMFPSGSTSIWGAKVFEGKEGVAGGVMNERESILLACGLKIWNREHK